MHHYNFFRWSKKGFENNWGIGFILIEGWHSTCLEFMQFVQWSQTGMKNQRKGRFQTDPYWAVWQNYLPKSLAPVGNNRNLNWTIFFPVLLSGGKEQCMAINANIDPFGGAKLYPSRWCVKRRSGSILSKPQHLCWGSRRVDFFPMV
jgi:hypothetical protein